MTASASTVHIVDDDPAVRDSLALLLDLQGFKTETYAAAEDFLEVCAPDWSGCVIVDLRMPGMSGLELQSEMTGRGITMPVVIITAHGDVSAARTSLKGGAVDFLEKPIDNQQLMTAIRAALVRDAQQREKVAESGRVTEYLKRLTAREREVLDYVFAGLHNREIAEKLDISVRTVEVYKARLMAKMGVDRLADLIRILLSAPRK